MKRAAIVIIFPILALLAWWGSLEYARQNGRILRVAVEGYDPRDLLAGHYLTFQLSLGEFQSCGNSADSSNYGSYAEACVCFSAQALPTISSPSWIGECSARPSTCEAFIRGTCRYARFTSPVNRYYIPERISSATWTAPPNSSVEVAIDSSGGATVRKFFVGDETLEDYAKGRLIKTQ